jgi:hypothetical protein
MLKNWQFNVLFFVGVGGAVVLLLGPEFGLDINQNPTAVAGIGAILSYILTQKNALTKNEDTKTKKSIKPPDSDSQQEDS